MQPSARSIAILALPFLLTAFLFAQDDAKPAPSSQDPSAGGSAAAPPPPQAAPAPTPKPKPDPGGGGSTRSENTPGAELFFGYAYLNFRTTTGVTTTTGTRTVDNNFDYIPGGEGALQGNVNNWFGLKADFSVYSLHDVSQVDSKVFTYLFGPVFSAHKHKFTPFLHTLVGGARITEDVPKTFTGGNTAFFARGKFHQNSVAADGGVGLDWNASPHIAVRLFQGDYLYTRFTDFANQRQNSIRASAGIVFRMGVGAPPPPPPKRPPTATCSANPTTVEAGSGATAAIRADAASPDNYPLTYTWSATGGTVDGTGPAVHWNSGTVEAGTYTVTAHVDDGHGGTVSCSADVQVTPKPIQPPTLTCAAATTSVPVGQRVAITATGTDPQNLPLTYTWQATGGQVVGSGAQVQWDTTGIAPGHYTVNGHADNGKGGTADCKVDLDVQIPVEQKQLEERLTLHSVFFPTALPTERNPNGGLLDSQQKILTTAATDFKRYLTFQPDARLILHGHADHRGPAAYNQALSERRVARVKAFLVEQGVPADHIETQGLGEEEPLHPEEIRTMAEQDPNLTPDQKIRIARNAKVIALAQSRRVDLTLSTTGETSQRRYPFNAEDVLKLINPKGPAAAPAKAAPKRKTPAPAPKPQ